MGLYDNRRGTIKATGTLDAATESVGPVSALSGDRVAVSAIDSTFTGTVQLQRSLDGTNWGVVEEYTDDGAEKIVEVATDGEQFRLYCSARSAGSVLGTLVVSTNERGR